MKPKIEDGISEDEKNMVPDGRWTESDTVESSPDFQDMFQDEVVSFLEENNPELLDLMKQAGLEIEDADEETA